VFAVANLADLKEFTAVDALFCPIKNCTKLKVDLFPAKSVFFSEELYKCFCVCTACCLYLLEVSLLVFHSVTSYCVHFFFKDDVMVDINPTLSVNQFIFLFVEELL
jgi:hypothetical protein